MADRSEQPMARLALEDGSVHRGRSFGDASSHRLIQAEVVFNTSMTGYQEALTDPSYAGQILVMTAPMTGVYGVNDVDVESARVQVAGFVVRELVERPSNHRASSGLGDYLAREGALGLTGVDTRLITRRLRSAGVMRGVLTSDPSKTDAELVEIARSSPAMAGMNLVPGVSCSKQQRWTQTLGEWGPGAGRQPGRPLHVLAFDCGVKRNILRHLTDRGCEVTVIPHDTGAEQIRHQRESGGCDGLFVSNGPGDPAAVEDAIATLRELVAGEAAETIPTFGICLGCQLLALALGATTFKLKYGHRGANQPVQNLLADRIEITSQNHGFAVDPQSLERVGGEPTHVNLNDGTLAGFRMTDRPLFAVQHHPEASPGPHDANYLFDAFVRMMVSGEPVDAATMAAARASQDPLSPAAR